MARGGLIKSMLRRYAPQVRARGRTLRKFSNKIGLVYFGTVDQRADEHDVIRGLTASTTHQDTHYAVGSYDGYDVSLVDRVDIAPASPPKEYTWVILRVDLKRDTLPHVFLMPRDDHDHQYSPHAMASRHLMDIDDMLSPPRHDDFGRRYRMYAKSTNAQTIDEGLPPAITQVIAARFWPHAVEIWDGKLYVYLTEHRLNETVLGATLDAALWLAEALDTTEN
jgi:hypothetical protein